MQHNAECAFHTKAAVAIDEESIKSDIGSRLASNQQNIVDQVPRILDGNCIVLRQRSLQKRCVNVCDVFYRYAR